MITFKQYLEESRSAPLYHGTGVDAMVAMLKTGVMKGSYEKRVSFTRDFRYALRWPEVQGRPSTVVIEFDQQKLTNNYRIKPINFWHKYEDGEEVPARRAGNFKTRNGKFENEYEESIEGEVKNATRYIKRIYIEEGRGMKYFESELPNYKTLFPNIEFVTGLKRVK